MQAAEWKECRRALAHSLPLLLSTSILGIVFGALVIAGGFAAYDGLAMSGFVYSGAAQFVGLQLISSETGFFVTLATTFFISLRFFLYALGLVEDVKHWSFGYRMFLAFGLIDAVFILAKKRFAEDGSDAEKKTYYTSCVLFFYSSWILGTFIGVFLGESLAKYSAEYGLVFFSYAIFLTLLVPYLKVRKNLFVAVLALCLYLLVWSAPYKLGILIACLGAALIVQLICTFMDSMRHKRKSAHQ